MKAPSISARLEVVALAALAVALQLESWLQPSGGRPLAALAALLFALALALRRLAPARALVFATTLLSVQAILGGGLGMGSGVPVLLGLAWLAYTVGVERSILSGLLALVAGGFAFTGFALEASPSPGAALANELFISLVALVAPWLVGRAARRRRDRTAGFEALAAITTLEREKHEETAIDLERARIAAELQDVISESVSAMVLQAGGARGVLREDPVGAGRAILEFERLGREALEDLRRLLGVLRRSADSEELSPLPGFDQLEALLAGDPGLACDLHHEGERVELAPGVELLAYRVIEGALAAASRRRCQHAAVTLRWQEERLEMEVRGDGSGADPDPELEPLGERLSLYEGTLEDLRLPAGGFALRARLPITPREAG